jgi:hypothetical protein
VGKNSRIFITNIQSSLVNTQIYARYFIFIGLGGLTRIVIAGLMERQRIRTFTAFMAAAAMGFASVASSATPTGRAVA